MNPMPMRKVFTLRATPGFLADVHEAAEAVGMTASDFIRDAVGDRINRRFRKRRENRHRNWREADAA